MIGGFAGKINARALAHDPEKLVLDLIGDGHRFSEKIVHNQIRENPGLRRRGWGCF